MESQKLKVKSQKCKSKIKSIVLNVILACPESQNSVPLLRERFWTAARMTKKATFNFLLVLLTFNFCLLTSNTAFAALPSSTNYKLQNYSFGAGGTATSSSQNYRLHGLAGQIEFGSPSSQNFRIGSGLTFIMQASVAATPTFNNPGDNYDRLHFAISPISDPGDYEYAIAISTDNFSADTRYIKSDNTIGTTLTNDDFQTFVNWGGTTGEYVTGLLQNTNYQIKVKARQGDFTETQYSESAQATTSTPSLTFSVSSNTVTFDNLNSGNSYTDSSKSTVLTTSTNAYNGYIVNARSTGPLTAPEISSTISDYGSANSNPTSWSGLGFGYTTNDSNLTGGTADRFTNGGPNYAGFTTSSPGDPVADHAGPVTSAISNENFTVSYRVTTNQIQKAGEYSTTVLYIVVPSY